MSDELMSTDLFPLVHGGVALIPPVLNLLGALQHSGGEVAAPVVKPLVSDDPLDRLEVSMLAARIADSVTEAEVRVGRLLEAARAASAAGGIPVVTYDDAQLLLQWTNRRYLGARNQHRLELEVELDLDKLAADHPLLTLSVLTFTLRSALDALVP